MEVRVATRDVERAKLLVVDLVGLFGGTQVSLRPDGAVQVHLRGEVNGALAHTLQAIENWLEQTNTASAQVSVDERSYTVELPERAQSSKPPSRSNGSSSPGARVAEKIGASPKAVLPR
jgi:predicted DNA-binding transcriptional regulator YafY